VCPLKKEQAGMILLAGGKRDRVDRTRQVPMAPDSPWTEAPGQIVPNFILSQQINFPLVRTNFHIFRRHIALPQDHSSWVFILSHLLMDCVGGNLSWASFALISFFWQPFNPPAFNRNC
jgi:hypothetical protein